MKTLIIGGDSKIGRELYKTLTKKNYICYKTTRSQNFIDEKNTIYFDLELLNFENLPYSDIAFICASITDFTVCRNAPNYSYRINVTNTSSLVKKLLEENTKIIYLSTSFVFNGKYPKREINSKICPISNYGYTKAEAEKAIYQIDSNINIVRLTKILPIKFDLFSKWCEDLRDNKNIYAFTDLWFAPVFIDYVIDSLITIAKSKETGIFQLSATEDINYFEAAKYIAYKLSINQNKILPDSAENRCIPKDVRPRFTSMNTNRIEYLSGHPAPSPRDSINLWLKAQNND